MNSQEAIETYAALVSILRENQLDWVVSQVEDQLRLGKIEKSKIDTLKDSSSEARIFQASDAQNHEFMKGPKATFLTSVPYDPSERVSLLVDAIEQAVVSTAEMEHDLIEHFESQVPNLVGVTFYSEELAARSTELSRQTSRFRGASISFLGKTLESMRTESKR